MVSRARSFSAGGTPSSTSRNSTSAAEARALSIIRWRWPGTNISERMKSISIAPRHAQHVLADEVEDHVVADGRGQEQPRFPKLALDVVLDGEAVAAVCVHAGVGRFPGGLAGQHLGRVRFEPALLVGIE